MTWPATATSFQAYFTREFPYGPGRDSVTPADIQRGLDMAGMTFKDAAWDNDTQRATAYLYLAAHFLRQNLEAAGGLQPTGSRKGLKSDGRGVITSKSVGSVSLSQEFAQKIKDDPILGPLLTTPFGQTYLALMLPRIDRMIVIGGQPMGYLSGE